MSTPDTTVVDPGPIGPDPTLERAANPMLLDLASGLAAATALWSPHVHHGADRRPVRLAATDTWEAWIIGWSEGHQVEMHDHGLSTGALAVVEGELTELVLDGRRTRSRTLASGTVHPLAAGLVHDVLAAGRATSLHVYSPALTSMTYYDDHGRPAWTAMVEPEDPVVDLRSVARTLHPATARA